MPVLVTSLFLCVTDKMLGSDLLLLRYTGDPQLLYYILLGHRHCVVGHQSKLAAAPIPGMVGASLSSLDIEKISPN